MESALDDLRHDAKRDRIFNLGDTIDHGPRSTDALEWMQPRFTCTVRGNHEEVMRDWTVLGARRSNQDGDWYRQWGKRWLGGATFSSNLLIFWTN